jgi:hypothetical protein
LDCRRPALTLGSGGGKSIVGEDVETLKRRLPLLDYLRHHNWTGHPASRSEFVGLCPLHEETRPSFYVNTRKDVFYCHRFFEQPQDLCDALFTKFDYVRHHPQEIENLLHPFF